MRHGKVLKSQSKLLPPISVRGMKVLNRQKFRKRLKVFTLLCAHDQLGYVLEELQPYVLKMEQLSPVQPAQSVPQTIVERNTENDEDMLNMGQILLNPYKITSWDNLPVNFLEDENIYEDHFVPHNIDLGFENWGHAAILKSVLPSNVYDHLSVSSVGHIVHVNLRDNLLPYKQLIGQVLLDKMANCRTVVNKCAVISNTYRFFEFELLCGEPNYEVETKENGYRYKLDFSTVYWNPRLSTEHERIAIKLISKHDVLYDVFAGVGPFAVPAAAKGATVLANDLNPESVRWLKYNIESNTRSNVNTYAECYNMDGGAFIREIVKPDLIKRWFVQSAIISLGYEIYVVMNLPDSALEFLHEFRGLFEHEADSVNFDLTEFKFPHIIFYTFAVGDVETAEETIRTKLELELGIPMDNNILREIQIVLNVSPKKNMYRVRLCTNKFLLTAPKTRKSPNVDTSTIQPPNDDNRIEQKVEELKRKKVNKAEKKPRSKTATKRAYPFDTLMSTANNFIGVVAKKIKSIFFSNEAVEQKLQQSNKMMTTE